MGLILIIYQIVYLLRVDIADVVDAEAYATKAFDRWDCVEQIQEFRLFPVLEKLHGPFFGSIHWRL